MAELNDIFIGRQPIFDNKMRVYAYEILFRTAENASVANVIDDSVATAQVMTNLFSTFGLDDIVGEKVAFINFNEDFLLKDTQSFLPKRKVVIEVLETVHPTPEIKKQLKELSKKGYRIALDDYDFDDELSPFEELSDIIKVDIMAAGPKKMIANIPRLKQTKKRLLAEKVETKQQFEFCKQLGFDFFQGYFFAKPTVIKGKSLENNQANILRFLSSVFDPNIDMHKLSSMISQDVSMSQKLLKMASLTEDSDAIKSIHDVVLRLGLNRLQSWASVISLASASDKPSELLTTSLIRGKFCELVGEKVKDFSKDSYFVVGLFSTLDAVMDQPLEEILADLAFDEKIKQALLEEEKNGLAKTLNTVKQIEAGYIPITTHSGLSATEISAIYLQAMEFANKVDLA
jgi:EAL and modified HD-GYP domain-containing signal transduction protein